MSDTRRGFIPEDAVDFGEKALPVLKRASRDLAYLLDRDYNKDSAVEFIGNHFQLTSRQRIALSRSACPSATAQARKSRLKSADSIKGGKVYIDAFNLIITLEAALSPETTLLLCRDGTIRDLCGLHGTYRLIGDTEKAIRLIFRFLKEKEVAAALFYLDAPISNSGNLKTHILEIADNEIFPVEVELVDSTDRSLFDKDNVITSDSVILDKCKGWINAGFEIIREEMPERQLICFTNE